MSQNYIDKFAKYALLVGWFKSAVNVTEEKKMKHKHADKIMQFARMVEAGNHPESLVQVKSSSGNWFKASQPAWDEKSEYRVALAFVEGKPVFEGDHLFYKDGRRWVIADGINSLDGGETFFVCWTYEGLSSGIAGIDINCFSWNKPEEKNIESQFDQCRRQDYGTDCFKLGCVWIYVCPHAHKAKKVQNQADKCLEEMMEDFKQFLLKNYKLTIIKK